MQLFTTSFLSNFAMTIIEISRRMQDAYPFMQGRDYKDHAQFVDFLSLIIILFLYVWIFQDRQHSLIFAFIKTRSLNNSFALPSPRIFWPNKKINTEESVPQKFGKAHSVCFFGSHFLLLPNHVNQCTIDPMRFQINNIVIKNKLFYFIITNKFDLHFVYRIIRKCTCLINATYYNNYYYTIK